MYQYLSVNFNDAVNDINPPNVLREREQTEFVFVVLRKHHMKGYQNISPPVTMALLLMPRPVGTIAARSSLERIKYKQSPHILSLSLSNFICQAKRVSYH